MSRLTAIATVIGILTGGATLIGIGTTYVQNAVAAEAATREERDLETQLEMINHEIKYLRQCNCDPDRLEYLLERRKIVMKRLEELK